MIAGGKSGEESLAHRVDAVTRNLLPDEHYTIDNHGHNVVLTDEGIAAIENAFDCGNLFDDENLALHTAMQDSLHAHVAAIVELREGIHWVSFGGRDPHHEYLSNVHTMLEALQDRIDDEVQRRLAEGGGSRFDAAQRGATWTYLTTDQPFGSGAERIFRGLMRKMQKRSVWG